MALPRVDFSEFCDLGEFCGFFFDFLLIVFFVNFTGFFCRFFVNFAFLWVF